MFVFNVIDNVLFHIPINDMYQWFAYYTWCLLKIISHVRVCCKTNRCINCLCVSHT